MEIPQVLIRQAELLGEKTKKRFPALAPLAKQCYLNTIETTVKKCDNGDHFVITGDIPALWLRDSAAQLRPYMPLCAESAELREIIRGVIRRHAFYVNLDPYSNAFNEVSHPKSHRDETDFYSDYIWERKYEVDSLCASVYLVADYFDATGDMTVFDDALHAMFGKIIDTFVKEQDHEANSSYYFNRKNCRETDTLPCGGKGRPVAVTGMTWSGFRPSDDSCFYNYLIPSEMMAVVAMRRAARLLETGWNDKENAAKALKLADEIDAGIKKYGVVETEEFGKIWAYEVDGLGNSLLMDDANSPSLLAAPYIGYCEKDDPLYLNTRRFVLSKANPWYFEGKAASGVGSPHTGPDRIWHIALTMQILTSTDEDEKENCLAMLANTHAGTNFMHESFNKDDPSDFTRSWFAWANSLFAQMLASL
ncbi:MAG: glycoside hydrolase family 125 protein [Clostridia bacterium]|nr:glycoside hydrolase family 125 protein [Clostridia bacterium]